MRALKTILFHILYTFRGLILLGCRLLSGLFLLVFLCSLFMGHDFETSVKILMFVFAVGFGTLAWYYDMLLLKLKPDNVALTLFS